MNPVQKIVESLVEIKLHQDGDFLRIKETLTRIGVASRDTLYQSCHILHKQGKYYIVHFKELFALDGKQTDLSENDIARRNTIVDLLEQWNLLEVVNKQQISNPKASMNQIKVVPFKEKTMWNLESKYSIGKVIK